jgi:hypothetical protein
VICRAVCVCVCACVVMAGEWLVQTVLGEGEERRKEGNRAGGREVVAPSECECGVLLILDLDESVQCHGPALVHVDLVRLVPRLGVLLGVLSSPQEKRRRPGVRRRGRMAR